jgi:hypothetical protein
MTKQNDSKLDYIETYLDEIHLASDTLPNSIESDEPSTIHQEINSNPQIIKQNEEIFDFDLFCKEEIADIIKK